MKRLRFILPLSMLAFFSHCNGQTEKKELAGFIQDNIDSIYKKEKLPGIFVAVLNNGNRNYYTTGLANPDKQMLFDSATLFEIGSITKTFTAYVLTAVMQENKISETDLIIKYLPDSVQQNKNIANISFLSLMNHTSGLPRLPGNMKMVNMRQPYENYSLNELYTYLKNCSPKPNGKSNYSNLGAGLAGVLAERISAKTYTELVEKYIIVPFNMLSHGIPYNVENKSQGYFANGDKAEYWNMNVLTPAGGLKFSGKEMLTYLENMCFPKSEDSKIIVNKLTDQTATLNPKIAIGSGWHIFTKKDHQPVYWHNGGTYSFSTFCAFVKDKSQAVIVVINQFNKNDLSDGLGIKIIQKLISEE